MRISDWSSDVCSSDLRKENAFEYKLSSFDIDNDGVVEDVLMEVRTECSKNWMLPSSPRIFVLDKKTDRIDPRYGVWESNVLNPFFYRGKTYFARMYFSSHEIGRSHV